MKCLFTLSLSTFSLSFVSEFAVPITTRLLSLAALSSFQLLHFPPSAPSPRQPYSLNHYLFILSYFTDPSAGCISYGGEFTSPPPTASMTATSRVSSSSAIPRYSDYYLLKLIQLNTHVSLLFSFLFAFSSCSQLFPRAPS